MRILTALLLTAALFGAALAQNDKEAKKLTDKEIDKLIDLLGDDDEDKRKAAEQKLTEHGEQTHDAVRKAAKEHADADVRLRATLLEKAIARGAFRQLHKMAGHEKVVRSIAVTKDGKRAVTGSQDGTVRVWDLVSGKEIKKLTGHTSWTWQVVFSADEKQVLSSGGQDKTLRLWDADKGEEIRQYTGFPKRVYAADLSADGKYVLGGEGGDDGDDKNPAKNDIHVFDRQSGKLVHKLSGHTGYVWRAVFSPDSKRIASAGMNDSTFRLWDVESGKSTHVGKDAHEGNVVAVAFSPDGKHLFTAGREGKIKMWEAEGGKLIKTFEGLTGDREGVAESLDVSRDGKRFLTTDGKSAVLFDVESGKVVYRFEEHTEDIHAVALLADGRKALSAGGAKTEGKDFAVRLWTVPK